MPPEAVNLKARIKTLNAVLATKKDQSAVENALQAAKGDWSVAAAHLKDKLPAKSLQKVTLAHSLAEWTGDHSALVKELSAQPNVKSLRDVALNFNVGKLAALVQAKAISTDVAGTTSKKKAMSFAIALHNKLFAAETTAVLHRMVQDAEVPIADTNLRRGVASFLSNQPDFNIRTTSVYTALKHPEAFKDIAEEHRAGVVEHLKTLQRVQAISPVPAGRTASDEGQPDLGVSGREIPESTFLSAARQRSARKTARQVYTNCHQRAHPQRARADDDARGGRGHGPGDHRWQPDAVARTRRELQKVADEKAVPLNLETLFGSIDYCECDDCLSVYSPAAYFVELLQYLRNNNLDPDPATGIPDQQEHHPGSPARRSKSCSAAGRTSAAWN